jgi:pyruvate,water dikinase
MSGLHLDEHLVVATEECRPEHVDLVGGKAVGLGSLLRAGQRVPPSFVITAGAYLDYVRAEPRRVSDPMRRAIEQSYAELGGAVGAADAGSTAADTVATWGVTVAVRSSATIEDSSEASCAGQFRTFLGASGASEVVEQVEQCWVAAFAPHVESYRAERRIEPGDDGVAVIVQQLVDARVAGVMFTQHPRTGDRSLIVIEASYGLGEAVVGGEVTPDLFEVNKITRQVHGSSLGSKPFEHRLAPDGRGVATMPVDTDRQQAWSITDDEVQALVAMASELESKLGRGLDVEWAIGTTAGGADEALFALQVRPITVDPRHKGAEVPKGSAIDLILGRLAGTSTGKEAE